MRLRPNGLSLGLIIVQHPKVQNALGAFVMFDN